LSTLPYYLIIRYIIYRPDLGNLADLDGELRRVVHIHQLNQNHFDYNNETSMVAMMIS
jgi:hypothetical protein